MGTAVLGTRCTLCRQSPLPDPDGSSTSVASCVSPNHSRRCWIYFYINFIKATSNLNYIYKRRPVTNIVHFNAIALRDIAMLLSHLRRPSSMFPKTESLSGKSRLSLYSLTPEPGHVSLLSLTASRAS